MEYKGEKKITKEKEFHNQWARSIKLEELLVVESFESPTAPENRAALKFLGNINGKKVLDLGCGAGESSVYFALKGAKVSACDIAEDFIGIGKDLSAQYKVNVDFAVAKAEQLPYPDDYFDCVFGNGVLHHVDLYPAGDEIHRVLKKGGKAVFVEPLPYNPVINVYRFLARDVRSEDEKPLSFGKIKKFSEKFSSYEHHEFWLFSLLIFLHFFFVRGWHPSKVRYWKRVIEVGKEYGDICKNLQWLDEKCIKFFPFMKYFFWNTVLLVTK